MSPGGNFAELKAWVLSQLLWDPGNATSVAEGASSALVSEFITAYYGASAAEYVQDFLTSLEKSALDADSSMGLNPEPSAKFLSPAFVLGAETLLDNAATKAAADGSDFVRRCEVLRMGVWYVLLWRFEEMKAYAAAESPPLTWKWGDLPSESLFPAFARLYSATGITHLSESGHDIYWLRRKVCLDARALAPPRSSSAVTPARSLRVKSRVVVFNVAREKQVHTLLSHRRFTIDVPDATPSTASHSLDQLGVKIARLTCGEDVASSNVAIACEGCTCPLPRDYDTYVRVLLPPSIADQVCRSCNHSQGLNADDVLARLRLLAEQTEILQVQVDVIRGGR